MIYLLINAPVFDNFQLEALRSRITLSLSSSFLVLTTSMTQSTKHQQCQ